MKNFKLCYARFMGVLFMVAAAFVFMTSYATVYYSFWTNQFMRVVETGNWGTPYELLASALQITAIVLIARGAASPIKLGRKVEWWEVALSAAVFSFFYYWSLPFVEFFTRIGSDASLIVRLNSYFYSFGKENFFAFIPSSLMMVGAELLRRRVGMWFMNEPPAVPVTEISVELVEGDELVPPHMKLVQS